MKSDIQPFTRILWVWVGAFIGWLLGVGFDGSAEKMRDVIFFIKLALLACILNYLFIRYKGKS
ncbi:hypothetical protein PYK22_02060 [Pyrinomonas methylaliphatogenes]|jgi:hypothetical protein|uniref:Uncharacterized protein n=1 Tax=Pyrinomonas methylaliphatogenes TaxID=454194 RepID=A0A0B6WY63_9BACT|nr:hypothetical protein PYK22_02060 [Pyrinomonas methylaliphatogenes]